MADFSETPGGLSSRIMNFASILMRPGSLKVPRYQRPYTWTEVEVRQLIQDLRAAAERAANFYFVGQIVLVRNARKEYEISDGQQRLTTLTMILAYARDRLPSRADLFQKLILNRKAEKPCLIVREEDASFFRGYVQEPGQMAKLALLDKTGSDSKDALIAAANAIAGEMGDMRDAQLEALILYVAERATFNVVDANERGAADKVFNTLNMRGQALSGADNIKCDLLENSRLSDEDANAAARKWEELENDLGRERFETLLQVMPFLVAGDHFRAPGDLAAFRAQVDQIGGVRTFLFDVLPRYAAAQRDILVGAVDVGPASAEVNRRLATMKLLKEWNWMPAALTFLAEHRKPQNAQAFFQALDCYSFACAISGEVILHQRRARRFANAARYAGDLRRALSTDALGITPEEQGRLIARLNNVQKDKFERVLLFRIEAALPGGTIITSMDQDVTVEHILPERGVTEYWNTRFPNQASRLSAAKMLGNMTLVTHAQNSAAGCDSFPEKLKIFFNTPVAPVHALTRPLKDVKEWTREEIEGRHEEMVYSLLVDFGLMKKPG